MKDKNKKTLESIKAAFKAAKDKLANVIRCKDEDSYIYTETLYNASKNLIVFVSFSNDYLSDAAELLEAAYDSHRHSVHVKYNHTEYDEYLDNEDDDGRYRVIEHRKYYLLFAGNPDEYNAFYSRISNLGNAILKSISKEIFNNRCPSEFERLIKDNVFRNGDFKTEEPQYDEYVRTGDRCHYDNVALIIKRLPNSFSTIDLLELVNCYNDTFEACSAYNMLLKAQHSSNGENYRSLMGTIFSEFFDELISDMSVSAFTELIGPKYKISTDIGFQGASSDADIDDIFKQQYDRFNAIADLETIQYEDIDEIMEEFRDDSIDIYSDSSMEKKEDK